MARGADLRVYARARCLETRIERMRRRLITAIGLRLGRRNQCHHLAVELILQRALSDFAEAAVEHQYHDAAEQSERYGDRDEQSPAERMHAAPDVRLDRRVPRQRQPITAAAQ